MHGGFAAFLVVGGDVGVEGWEAGGLRGAFLVGVDMAYDFRFVGRALLACLNYWKEEVRALHVGN